jgi:uncharacterized protein YaaN involved in tellurite resistance
MSLQNSESSVSKSFQELLNYVSNLGEHINKIYTHLETIEKNLTITKDDLTQSIIGNKTDLERLNEIIITKSELNNLLQKINEPFEKFTPPKTPERSYED